METEEVINNFVVVNGGELRNMKMEYIIIRVD